MGIYINTATGNTRVFRICWGFKQGDDVTKVEARHKSEWFPTGDTPCGSTNEQLWRNHCIELNEQHPDLHHWVEGDWMHISNFK